MQFKLTLARLGGDHRERAGALGPPDLLFLLRGSAGYQRRVQRPKHRAGEAGR